MNIAIVDDVAAEIDAFAAAIKEYSVLNRMEIGIDRYDCAEAFLESYTPLKYTIIVMDIYMDGMTGLEAVQRIKKTDKNTIIVFLSSSGEHYPDALKLHVYDYLGKPADKARIFGLLDDITQQTTETCGSLDFTYERTARRIPYSNIVTVSACGHYIEITDTENAVYKPRIAYSEVCDALSGDKRFLSVNRGVLVNMEYISGFENGVCVIENGIKLPVNVRNRKTLEQTWQNYVFAEVRDHAARKSRKQ